MLKENFIQYIQFEKRYSSNTVIAYQKDLDQFFSFINNEYNIYNLNDVDYLMIRSWLVNLMELSLTTRSVNRKLTTLKSFYKYLIKEGVIKENPMIKIISPKTSKKLPVFVEKKKMDLLFDDIDFGNNFCGIRDRLILEMFYHTGMRLSELVNLLHSDIDIYNSTIKVLGKRNKERIIPFGNNLKDLLSQYINIKQKLFRKKEESKYFFTTEKGRKIYNKLVYRIVNLYLGKVTTLDKKSPHVLRHTFATHMLNNGADLNSIKELLGHANLSATQIYTHNTIEKLKNIYKQAHPRA
ncbi:MAG: tyrosine recombinase XerC [Bacteroidales bacterium]|nr:tyrosine recombinase XerC [Bacteroidales bacterium]